MSVGNTTSKNQLYYNPQYQHNLRATQRVDKVLYVDLNFASVPAFLVRKGEKGCGIVGMKE